MVCLLTMDLLAVDSLESTPKDSKAGSSKAIREKYLEHLAQSVVQSVWHQLSQQEVVDVLTADIDDKEAESDSDSEDDFPWCCGNGNDMSYIGYHQRLINDGKFISMSLTIIIGCIYFTLLIHYHVHHIIAGTA